MLTWVNDTGHSCILLDGRDVVARISRTGWSPHPESWSWEVGASKRVTGQVSTRDEAKQAVMKVVGEDKAVW